MKKNQTGFTLIELLVVVLIIGILAAIALPQYRVAVERSRVAQALPLFRALIDAQQRYEMANGEVSADVDLFDISFAYTSKTPYSASNGAVGFAYTMSPLGSFRLVVQKAVFWSSDYGYTIDFHGLPQSSLDGAVALCYPSVAGSTAERVCQGFGKKTSRISSMGTPVYALDL